MLDGLAEVGLVISDEDVVIVLAHADDEDDFDENESQGCQEYCLNDICGTIGVYYVQDAVNQGKTGCAVFENGDEFLKAFAEASFSLELGI